jgi:hypothetical protein
MILNVNGEREKARNERTKCMQRNAGSTTLSLFLAGLDSVNKKVEPLSG